ncbi:MAG TPA: hypothetical protein VGE67_18195 [Haloferula sp.]
MKLHLKEEGSWAGILFDLVISSGEVVFAGHESYAGRLPGKFTLREGSLERLEAAFGLLELPCWKPVYRPEDIGSVVDDGESWSLDVEFGGVRVSSRGSNAYPSFKLATETSLFGERWNLLREAVFSTLDFSVPFGWSRSSDRKIIH